MPWDHRSRGQKLDIHSPNEGRKIKGNINRKGVRLYHCLTDRSYKATRITVARGEKWFSTPQEAEAQGWSRASNTVRCVY
jgi:hypothetical protein